MTNIEDLIREHLSQQDLQHVQSVILSKGAQMMLIKQMGLPDGLIYISKYAGYPVERWATRSIVVGIRTKGGECNG